MDARVNDDPPFSVERTRGERAPPAPKRAPSLLARVGRALRILLMVVLPVALVAGALAGFGWMRATKPVVPVERQSERARAVSAVVAEPAAVQPTLTVYGRIVAGRSVDLRALVSGPIVEVSDALVDGGRVAQGEALITVDAFAFEGALIRARADLAEAQARLAELDARRRQENRTAIRPRTRPAEIAQREFRTPHTAAREKRQRLRPRLRRRANCGVLPGRGRAGDARRSQLAILRHAQSRSAGASLDRPAVQRSPQAERNLEDTVLRAPFDALVSNVGAEIGKGGLAERPHRDAQSPSTGWRRRFLLSDAQYARLAPPRRARVAAPSLVIWSAGDSEIAREAIVTRVASEAADASFAVFAAFTDDVDSDVLRPGRLRRGAARGPKCSEDALVLAGSPRSTTAASSSSDDESRLVRVEVEVLTYGEEGVAGARGRHPAGRPSILASRLAAAGAGQLVEVRR